MTSNTIDVATLQAWLRDGAELAVLDVRAKDEVGYASPLFATNLPADQVPAELSTYVPRKAVRTVLIDDGLGAADQLVQTLAADGWSAVVALAGGIPAWIEQEADETFDIPGRDFSLSIRDERATQAVTVEELRQLREQDADVIVIDTRTQPEFTAGHVPGAVGVPGAELLLRFADLVPCPATHVVVSCAGLPRAIIGAQTLIDAGVPNQVSFLYDGTKAWQEDGSPLETGAPQAYRPIDDDARKYVEQRVTTISAADRFPQVDEATAARWAGDPERTTYLLDVRTPEEFAAGHLPGSISAEGGQLLGVAHRTIAVRGARVVLIDDLLGARAAVTAHWLQRRGYEIAVLLNDFEAAA